MISRVIGTLLGPHPRVQEKQARRQSRVLSFFVLVLPLVMGTIDINRSLEIPNYRVPWYGYAIMLLAYASNRAGYYREASFLVTGLFPVTVAVNILRASSPLPLLSLAFLPLGSLVAAVLMKRTGVITIAILNSIALVVLAAVAPHDVPYPAVFIPYMALNWAITILALILLHLRELAVLDQIKDRLALDAVFDQTAQMVGLLWPDGRIAAVNATALRTFGKKSSELVDRHFSEAGWWTRVDRERLNKAISAAAGGQKTPSFQTIHKTADGAERHVHFTVSPYRDGDGKVVYLIAEGRDVTELVEAQKNLHHSRRMEALGQLAGGVAHDFNNQLGAILNAAELIRRPQTSPAERADFAVSILASAKRAAELIRKLLDFSRRKASTTQPIRLDHVIDNVLEILTRTVDKRVRFEHAWVTGDSAESVVLANEAQVQGLFLNLGINAAQAMEAGGLVTFRGQLQFLNDEYCASSPFPIRPGVHVHYQVEDNGAGIDAALQERIFEPFFTTKPVGQGTGLGLATAYATVVEHGGSIAVTSAVGRGTIFDVYLPLIARLPAQAARERVTVGTGLRVLVVDDETMIRQTTQALLATIGYEVDTAAGGHEALAAYAKKRPDIVLLDLAMPDMNGAECFRQLRAADPEAIIILSSGYAAEEELDSLVAGGLNGFVAKPYTLIELSVAIRQALEGRPDDDT